LDEENQDLDTTEAPVEEQGTGEVDVAAPSASEETGTQPTADATQGQPEETFLTGEENLDPRKLDPALQPIFKRMQAVYTKRMQGVAEIRDKASVVDRFYNDPGFAQQTLQTWAQQNGYQLTRQGEKAQGGQSGPAAADAPGYLVDAFKQNLAPELQWMAEPLAKAQWASMQGMLAPVFQQHQQRTVEQRQAEWDKHAAELSGVAPAWEEHEDTMGELFDFLSDKSALSHPKYGSKLQMLYDLATAKAASMKQATQRVANAGKNRVTSGRPSGSAGRPTIESEIAKASSQDAWKLAVKHALSQHKQPA
jgi:hypothetical protein